VTQVYWRTGAGQIPLRLFIVAPTPYRKRKSSKLYYRQPAYLLSTDLRHSAPQLLQIYLDRCRFEVNHRDEKDTLGVGQAQLWNVDAVPKQPALVVAAYSALLLAALKAFGTERTQALSGPAQVATQGPPPILPRPGHPAPPRNVDHPGRSPNLWASNSLTAPSPSTLTREKCRNSRERLRLSIAKPHLTTSSAPPGRHGLSGGADTKKSNDIARKSRRLSAEQAAEPCEPILDSLIG